MFHFPAYASRHKVGISEGCSEGFPHSEIAGSKVARHLPDAYRRQTASFIASWSQGIHHAPLHSCEECKNRSCRAERGNTKLQSPETKQTTNFNIQSTNSACRVWVLKFRSLEFVWNLFLGFWDFRAPHGFTYFNSRFFAYYSFVKQLSSSHQKRFLRDKKSAQRAEKDSIARLRALSFPLASYCNHHT